MADDFDFMRFIWCGKKYLTLLTSEEDIGVFAKFLESILLLRSRWAFSVTSWGRTDKRNTFVNGVPGSLHLLWLAIDVVLDDQKKSVDFEMDADRLGLLAIYEGDHYHLQTK